MVDVLQGGAFQLFIGLYGVVVPGVHGGSVSIVEEVPVLCDLLVGQDTFQVAEKLVLRIALKHLGISDERLDLSGLHLQKHFFLG